MCMNLLTDSIQVYILQLNLLKQLHIFQQMMLTDPIKNHDKYLDKIHIYYIIFS